MNERFAAPSPVAENAVKQCKQAMFDAAEVLVPFPKEIRDFQKDYSREVVSDVVTVSVKMMVRVAAFR